MSLLEEEWSRNMFIWGTARPAWLRQSEEGAGRAGVGNWVGSEDAQKSLVFS